MCEYNSFIDLDLFDSPEWVTICDFSLEDVKKQKESEFRNKLIRLQSGLKISLYSGHTSKFKTSRCGIIAQLTNGTKVPLLDAMSLVDEMFRGKEMGSKKINVNMENPRRSWLIYGKKQ